MSFYKNLLPGEYISGFVDGEGCFDLQCSGKEKILTLKKERKDFLK